MSATRTAAFLFVGLVIGIAAGYGVGFIVYQPQISQLQSNLSEAQDSIASLETDLTEAQDTITSLETQLNEFVAKDLTQLYGNVTRLTTDPAFEWIIDWSPDGSKMFFKQMLFQQKKSYICVMNSDGSNMKRLVEGVGLALSSDGTNVFFYRQIRAESGRTLGWALWVMNVDGSNAERLSEIRCDGMNETMFIYDLSPDETRIVYLTREPDGYLWRRHLRDELPSTWEKTEKRGYSSEPPDYYPGYIYDWWVWDMSKNESKLLLSEEPFPGLHYPQVGEVKWSLDGKKIALPMSNISLAIEGRYDDEQVFVVDIESGEKNQLTFEQGCNAWPAWSPDEQKIMYQRSEMENAWKLIGFDIWVMYSDGSNKRQLTDSPGYEDGWWSPDGSKIAYISHSPGIFDRDKKSEEDRSEIWAMNADGSDKQQLLSVPYRYGLIAEMQWSPDGTRLAFVWDPDVEDVGSDIYLIDVSSN